VDKSAEERHSVLQNIFDEIYPFASRAAQVRSARVGNSLQAMAFDRADLEQEALMGVWMALRRFDPARASPRTYVERVVATNIASVFRRAKSQKRTPRSEPWPTPLPLRLLVAVELRLDFDRVLGRLEPRDRRVVELLTEHRPARIARILGISRAGIYRSIDRVRTVFSEAGFRRRSISASPDASPGNCVYSMRAVGATNERKAHFSDGRMPIVS
jgi:RNA polymerase sigma factor (sigma-70 family)